MKHFLLALTLTASLTSAVLAFDTQQPIQGGTLYNYGTNSFSTITPTPNGGATIYDGGRNSFTTITPRLGGGATIYDSGSNSFSTFIPTPTPQIQPFGFGR